MSLEPIVDQKLRFYRRITTGNLRWIEAALRREGIGILDGFLKERELVRAFYRTYYRGSSRRIVICGINPGRLGAGRSGLPFLDFDTLRRFLNGHFEMEARRGRERSAAFIASVVDYFGAERFFDGVYLTNLSWFGFVQGGRNLNHDRLPPEIQKRLFADFNREMAVVRPRSILPVSKSVAAALARLRDQGMLRWPVGPRLDHPNYCAFPARFAAARWHYINTLRPHLGEPKPSRSAPHGVESR